MPKPRPARPVFVIGLALMLALAGCGGDDAGWPHLLPVEGLLAEAVPAPVEAPAAPLVAQANVLRARADQLRRAPVIEPETAARMREAAAAP